MNKKKIVISFIIIIIFCSAGLYSFAKKELLPVEDRGVYIIIGNTDEGSSFEYTEKRAEEVERRLIPLLQSPDSPYKRLIMRVPGFGNNKNSFNSFIIIALLDHWNNRKEDSITVMRQAIGKNCNSSRNCGIPNITTVN